MQIIKKRRKDGVVQRYHVKTRMKEFRRKVLFIGPNKIKVYMNPSRKDYDEISQRFKREYPDAFPGEPRSRKTFDGLGNMYLWMSGDTTHHYMEGYMVKQFNIKVNQQWEWWRK